MYGPPTYEEARWEDEEDMGEGGMSQDEIHEDAAFGSLYGDGHHDRGYHGRDHHARDHRSRDHRGRDHYGQAGHVVTTMVTSATTTMKRAIEWKKISAPSSSSAASLPR